MSTEWEGHKVKRVTIMAALQFDAYVVVNEDGQVEDWARIAGEIADAVEYHAPHLDDTEDGDALIATVYGGNGTVSVGVQSVVDSSIPFTTDDVVESVRGTRAWL